jgi:uncharacterized membrane protein YciS (DUF1049 family)
MKALSSPLSTVGEKDGMSMFAKVCLTTAFVMIVHCAALFAVFGKHIVEMNERMSFLWSDQWYYIPLPHWLQMPIACDALVWLLPAAYYYVYYRTLPDQVKYDIRSTLGGGALLGGIICAVMAFVAIVVAGHYAIPADHVILAAIIIVYASKCLTVIISDDDDHNMRWPYIVSAALYTLIAATCAWGLVVGIIVTAIETFATYLAVRTPDFMSNRIKAYARWRNEHKADAEPTYKPE